MSASVTHSGGQQPNVERLRVTLDGTDPTDAAALERRLAAQLTPELVPEVAGSVARQLAPLIAQAANEAVGR